MFNEEFVYIIINLINGKKYVGQTKNFQKRMKEHLVYFSKNSPYLIHKAIKKYGEENFKCIPIHCPKDKKNEWERFLIKEFDTITPKGYNLTEGGQNNNSWEFMSDEKKREIIDKIKEKRTGHTTSIKTKEQISKSLLIYFDKYGKPKEAIEKQRQQMFNVNNPMYKTSLYDFWLKKYGKEMADKKEKEWKKNLSQHPSPTKGKKRPEITGSNNPTSKKWKFISPSGEEFIIIGGFESFCQKHHLHPELMRKYSLGLQIKPHKGWKVIRYDTP